MSCQAIAAALARADLSGGERLVAFSLASFADRDNRARPGNAAAAARAGLGKSRYLQARERLVAGGLLVVEEAPSGRGRASTLALRFADDGPWWEGDVNAQLFEVVLGYSAARGPARLLLAALAALADESGVVADMTTERACRAAGLSDRSYRRARNALLAGGEVVVLSATGGRGNTNRWQVPDPRALARPTPPATARRVPAPRGARPLIAAVNSPIPDCSHTEQTEQAGVGGDVERARCEATENTGRDRTVSAPKGPNVTGVWPGKDGQDRPLSADNGPTLTGGNTTNTGQDRTLLPPNGPSVITSP